MNRTRRSLLQSLGAGAVWVLASGHTPYRQWAVYRRRYLLIGTSRADAPSYPLGKRVAAVLADELPESMARVSRAPDQRRLAHLLGTGQMQLVLLSRADAAALQQGRGLFAESGRVSLSALFRFGDHLLVSRPDFPDRHAYRLAAALSARAAELPAAAPIGAGEGPVLAHSGVLAWAEGRLLD